MAQLRPCQAWRYVVACTLFSLLGLASVTGQEQTEQLPSRRFLSQASNNGLSAAILTAQYYNNSVLAAKMHEIANSCGGVARVVKWGKSVKGEDLLALEVYGGGQEERYRPTFKYVGNLHGDEPSGRQLLLALADHVCKAREANNHEVVQLLQSVSLFMIPTANPDGWVAHTRENSRNMDLNRNYPDPWVHRGRDLRRPVGTEEAETLAMMNLTLSRRFVGSVAMHEGAIVANYPYDGYQDSSHDLRGTVHPCPDHDTFVHLASRYAQLHKTMSKSQEFPGGITNGARWYPVYGGMQDWNYLAAGCLEITLELDNVKTPDVKRLAEMWEENKEVFVKYPAELVLGGLRGFVFSSAGRMPLVAKIHVVTQGLNVTSAPTGDYFRPLAPGRYKVLVQAPGHLAVTNEVEIPKGGRGLVQDFTLPAMHQPSPPLRKGQPETAPGKSDPVKPHAHNAHAAHAGNDAGSGDSDTRQQFQGAGSPLIVDVYIRPEGLSGMSWVSVFIYVVLGPLVVVGLAVLAWRSSHVQRMLEPAYAAVGLSTRPWAREHKMGSEEEP